MSRPTRIRPTLDTDPSARRVPTRSSGWCAAGLALGTLGAIGCSASAGVNGSREDEHQAGGKTSVVAAGTTGAAAGGNAPSAGGATGVTSGGDGPAGAGGVAATAGGTDGGRGGMPAGGSHSSGGSAGRGGSESSAGSAGRSGGDDACPGAAFNPASPPQALPLTGNLGAHDPAAYVVGKTVYLAATGIASKSSTNLTDWTQWPASGGTRAGAWAPDISNFGGAFHLYYAVSTFGSNKSCIGQATRSALDSGTWLDKGNVLCSNMGSTKDNWNAIDPNIIVDDEGVPWLDFGSFWGGIKMAKLTLEGTRADMELHDLASGPSGGAVEGPFIFKRCGFYYLFVSFGSCCSDPYNYTIRVGRSATVTGPYTDRDGKAMMKGGGTLLVQGNSMWSAPGHNAVIVYENRTYNVYHALAAPSGQNGVATLRIAEIAWDANGWPVSGGP